ncbi:MAG: tRNA pseudouridine(38-40) synthase TruA [Bacteroidales bacterium]
MRYFISINYDGTTFVGWQKQPNGPSIQESLERALSLLLGEEILVTGAGRTDSGVHAVNYIAHFDSDSPTIIENLSHFIYKINAIIGTKIAVNSIYPVSPTAHARYSAIERRYNYYLHTTKNPFLELYSHYFPRELNIEKMNRAAKLLVGRRDFTSMAKLHSSSSNNISTVSRAEWSIGSPPPPLWNLSPSSLNVDLSKDLLKFEIVADRFLRDMVRAIVGTLLKIGIGKEDVGWIEEVLRERERGAAGDSVPAKGLFFVEVTYPPKLLKG